LRPFLGELKDPTGLGQGHHGQFVVRADTRKGVDDLVGWQLGESNLRLQFVIKEE
jgi:hypothetical protein